MVLTPWQRKHHLKQGKKFKKKSEDIMKEIKEVRKENSQVHLAALRTLG